MRELNISEIQSISGGKNFLSKAIEVVAGAVFTGVIEGIIGLSVAGPAGFVVGFGHGAFEGAAGVLIYEGGMGSWQSHSISQIFQHI